MALMDAANPCSLFVLFALCSWLWLAPQRQQALLGAVFGILIIGLTHYLQQTHASWFFNILAWLRIPALLVGAGILYCCWQRTMPLLAFTLFIILIQMYQQTCVMNWSFVFEQWLHHHDFSQGEQVFFKSIVSRYLFNAIDHHYRPIRYCLSLCTAI